MFDSARCADCTHLSEDDALCLVRVTAEYWAPTGSAGRARAGVALGDLGAGRWDWVVVVLYPSRSAFLSMMTSPEYQLANVDCESAVDDHVILAANESYSKFRI